jgi:hypothetical protein
MATRTSIIVSCDLDGKTADVETVAISVNGRAMELELCPGCKAKTLDKLLAKFEPVARVQAPARHVRTRRTQRTTARRSDATETRAWLKEHGYVVSGHGRISAQHLSAFAARKPALAAAS